MINLKDEYTVALGITAIAAYVVSKFLVPPSLVHPLLLGRQSHVAQVRKETESAVYRNYGIASSPLPIAPGRGVTNQLTLLKLEGANATAERWLWDRKISNAELMAKAEKMGAALCSVAGLVPKGSRVLMLLEDGLEWLISDLALGSYSIPTITVSSPTLIHEVIEKYPPNAILVQAKFLHHLLELLAENDSSTVVIVVGDRTGEVKKWSGKVHLRLVSWEDVEKSTGDAPSLSPPIAADISSAHFFAIENGALRGVQFTHQNIVAGANAVINIFPTSSPWSEKDTIISSHGLSTPFGRSILYAALYAGANFATFPSASLLKDEGISPSIAEVVRAAEDPHRPAPTLLFITPGLLGTLTTSIVRTSKQSFLFGLGWRHKHAALLRGYLVKDGLWDRAIFQSARLKALGNVTTNLRAIAVAGGHLDNAALLPARLAFSTPVTHVYVNPLSASPIFASHPLDMQILDTSDAPAEAHAGPPSCNIEVKLVGIDEAVLSAKGDPEGGLCIRGSGVGDPIPMGVQLEEGWIDSGIKARVRSNGTFVPFV